MVPNQSEKNPTNKTTTISDNNTTNHNVTSSEVTKDYKIVLTKDALEIIRNIKSKYLRRKVIPYKINRQRIRLVANRMKDFNQIWPGRNFLKACEFAFHYKAKEWKDTDTFRYFEPETLLSEKFVGYLEKAERDNGVPYKAQKNNSLSKTNEEPTFKSPFL